MALKPLTIWMIDDLLNSSHNIWMWTAVFSLLCTYNTLVNIWPNSVYIVTYIQLQLFFINTLRPYLVKIMYIVFMKCKKPKIEVTVKSSIAIAVYTRKCACKSLCKLWTYRWSITTIVIPSVLCKIWT